MDLLSISSSSSSTSLLCPHLLSRSKPSHHFSSFKLPKPFIYNSLRTAAPKPPKSLALGLAFETQRREQPHVTFEPSGASAQAPATAVRGGEADAMGLLLRERIVFLGSQIDDFVADTIISQLLLLDAQDHTKDIRLFINSPGGALR